MNNKSNNNQKDISNKYIGIRKNGITEYNTNDLNFVFSTYDKSLGKNVKPKDYSN